MFLYEIAYFLYFSETKSTTNNKTALMQIMACRRTDDKPLSEQMIACFTKKCIGQSA